MQSVEDVDHLAVPKCTKSPACSSLPSGEGCCVGVSVPEVGVRNVLKRYAIARTRPGTAEGAGPVVRVCAGRVQRRDRGSADGAVGAGEDLGHRRAEAVCHRGENDTGAGVARVQAYQDAPRFRSRRDNRQSIWFTRNGFNVTGWRPRTEKRSKNGAKAGRKPDSPHFIAEPSDRSHARVSPARPRGTLVVVAWCTGRPR